METSKPNCQYFGICRKILFLKIFLKVCVLYLRVVAERDVTTVFVMVLFFVICWAVFLNHITCDVAWKLCSCFFVQIWLSYQALWDLQADYLYGKLGSGLECWMKALEDIKFVHLLLVCLWLCNSRVDFSASLPLVQCWEGIIGLWNIPL